MQTIIRVPLTMKGTVSPLSCSQVGWRDGEIRLRAMFMVERPLCLSCDNLGHSACWGSDFRPL